MIEVFESIIPVFAIVILGFALRKGGLVPADNWRAVEELCFWIFFPCLLAMTLIKADLGAIEFGPYTLTLIFTVCSVAILTLVSWPVLHRIWGTTGGQFSTIFQTTTRWHGFIALAIVIKLFNEEGAALIAVSFAVMVPILQVSNILVLTAFSANHRLSPLQITKSVIVNPIIWGVSFGLFINLTGISLWQPVMTMFDLLGRAALGASLLVLGAGLSLKAALKPSRELLVGVFGKLILTPVVMAGWALWFGVSGLALTVLIVCAAVPTAMNGYLFAKKMGGDAELYAATSSIQTALSFFTIPVFLWLAQNYGSGLI
ncbi:MAG: AEC family transporter [Gammaproteobacteria bacterium]|jgi:hypothetical protein|nr:AEC family transporter [Gammaproteobacteria bacterium]MBT6457241.1 AEC family transporter [Gammaproteobacteria bacterium]MBT7046960.1 AEC family transporter [Gammaproteobacteria bacterium]